MKLKKYIILIAAMVIIMAIAVNAGIGNILTIFNPFTSTLDYIHDTNQSGQNWTFGDITIEGNLSGNSIAWNRTGDTVILAHDEDTVNISNDVNVGANLEVRNITSPFVNRSYIFFGSDGSVGITLDPR